MLHNDRKSRHRRIKKQRRYGRLAATSQFLDTEEFDAGISSCTNLIATRDTVVSLLAITISSGSSMYLRPRKTHTLPCVEPLSATNSFTRVGCWLSNPLNCLPYSSKYCTMRCYRHRLAFRALRTSQHPGVLLVSFSFLAVPRCSREITMSDTDLDIA